MGGSWRRHDTTRARPTMSAAGRAHGGQHVDKADEGLMAAPAHDGTQAHGHMATWYAGADYLSSIKGDRERTESSAAAVGIERLRRMGSEKAQERGTAGAANELSGRRKEKHSSGKLEARRGGEQKSCLDEQQDDEDEEHAHVGRDDRHGVSRWLAWWQGWGVMCKRETASRAVRVAQGNSTTLHCVARTPVHHPFSHHAGQQMSLLARQPSSLTAALDVAMALGALCPGTASQSPWPRLIAHGRAGPGTSPCPPCSPLAPSAWTARRLCSRAWRLHPPCAPWPPPGQFPPST
ncbi:hypothetical protein COCMIDRAFT_30518 [Bipolaris oryzae ATCC 44560]|uniref:Uncharacterized protein n=1 Tax=Bipolaris oryzae ATCC 44560 TaxID=930090 RepID=W6YSF8_COCMI|nr:uncharacterized protein COCMIDRAFT_30518 [Bipolaris oryzae ATCC 44560]EUC40555.1 hypothetical protein COCMIDRAFT_30518 [Bipolaris oryzae ATCC 44560]